MAEWDPIKLYIRTWFFRRGQAPGSQATVHRAVGARGPVAEAAFVGCARFG